MEPEISVPQPRIEAVPSAMEAQSPNHSITREVPRLYILKGRVCLKGPLEPSRNHLCVAFSRNSILHLLQLIFIPLGRN